MLDTPRDGQFEWVYRVLGIDVSDHHTAHGAAADRMVREVESASAATLVDESEEPRVEPPAEQTQGAEATDSAEPDGSLERRVRILIVNAHEGYADYLDARDAAADVASIEAALRRAEGALQAWRDEIETAGSSDGRKRMDLLSRKLELERRTFDAMQRQMARIDALISALQSETDPEQRPVLERAIQDALSSVAA